MANVRTPLSRALLALCMLASPLHSAHSQQPTVTIDSATLVRVHEPAGSFITGRLLVPFRPGDDTLRFCLYPANHCTAFDSLYRRATPMDRISAIDVQTGTKEVSGAIVGALVGLGFGIVATRAHVICGGDTTPAICSPLVGVPVGTLIGALIGHQIPGWRRAP